MRFDRTPEYSRMSTIPFIQFQHPWMLPGSGIFALGIAAIFLWRRIRLPRWSIFMGLAGLVLLCLGAGGLAIRWRGRPNIVVMVDLSPSTRTARFRDIQHLRQHVEQLLGGLSYRIVWFSDHNLEGSLDRLAVEPAEMESDRTIFTPPADASAVVLFSDGQFELPPLSSPVYAVVDPRLQSPADAAVMGMEQHGQEVWVRTTVQGEKRRLQVNNQTQTIAPPGQTILTAVSDDAPMSARFEKEDAWPENDAMELWPLQETRESWWVGDGSPGGWRQWSAEQLPLDAAVWLRPSIIVLNNIPARRLSDAQQGRLEQYVRDLGGGLVIVGGDQSFSVGGYIGSSLDDLSPLASHAPRATVHWILLADASGSMAQQADGGTRWDIAREAMHLLVGQLPPEDVLSIGSFSDRIVWWSEGKKAGDTIWAGGNVRPHGPTNLTGVLDELAKNRADGLPGQLLLMTDGQAPPPDGEKLVELFHKIDLHLHVLAIGQGEAMAVLRDVARRTGGSVVEQLDPQKWVRSAEEMLRGAMGQAVFREPVKMQWSGPGKWAMESIALWNRTWLKTGASLWGMTRHSGEEIPLVAQWQAGLGKVAAISFAADGQDVATLALQAAQRPKDPRWKVQWTLGPQLGVLVESTGDPILNEAPLVLRIVSQDGQTVDQHKLIPQTGPGQYELKMDRPRSAVFAGVQLGEQILDQRALAVTYAPEFAAIGNNHANLNELVNRSGGRLIEPGIHQRLDLNRPSRLIDLRSVTAFIGSMLILGAAIGWRKSWEQRI